MPHELSATRFTRSVSFSTNRLVLPRADDGSRSLDSGSARPGPDGAATESFLASWVPGDCGGSSRDDGGGSEDEAGCFAMSREDGAFGSTPRSSRRGMSGPARGPFLASCVSWDFAGSWRDDGAGLGGEAGCFAMSPREDGASSDATRSSRRGTGGAAMRSFLASCARTGSSRNNGRGS